MLVGSSGRDIATKVCTVNTKLACTTIEDQAENIHDVVVDLMEDAVVHARKLRLDRQCTSSLSDR